MSELDDALEAYFKSINNYLDAVQKHDAHDVDEFMRFNRLFSLCCLLLVVIGVVAFIGVFLT